jgi:hypothetical protein
VQTESLDEHEDPYADFYKALDEIIEEQSDGVDNLAGEIVENFESNDSNKDSKDDFDAWLEDYLANS